MAGPVQALHLWLVSLGLLAPVAMGTWCPSIRQSPAEASAGHGVLPALLVHLGPCPHAPKSAGLSGDVAACSLPSTARVALGSEASVKLLLGRRYLAPLVLERKLGAGRAGSGGGSRAEISTVTQAGQEHFIKSLSLPLASGDLWGAAVRDVATANCRSAAPVTWRHPAGARLAFRRP